MSDECPSCGSREKEYDDETFCPNCGYVFPTSNLANDKEWDKESKVVGDFYSAESAKRGTSEAQKSTEITMEIVRRRIREIARSVGGLQQHNIERAGRFYKEALLHRFSSGRKRDHVISACLYLVCRLEQTEHMLVDFTDVLPESKKSKKPVSVYQLGQTYGALAKLLKIEKLPLVDPSLYIHRFAAQLEFGDKQQDVAQTALRLIQSMRRDWIQTGRRPSGICGAALIIAARLHGFQRTPDDLVDIVRIGDITLRRRISEFINTPTCDLTRSQLETMDLKSDTLPPCVIRSQKREERKRKGKKKKKDGKIKGKKRKRISSLQNLTKKPRIEKSILEKIVEEEMEEAIPATEVEADISTALFDLNSSETLKMFEEEFMDGPQHKSSTVDSKDLESKEKGKLNISCNKSSENPLQNTVAELVPFQPLKDHINELGEDTFSDIDDEEINSYILPEEAAKAKSFLWHHFNKDWLEDQANKSVQQKEQTEKKKRGKKTVAASAGEAVDQVLQRIPKANSSLIDWNAYNTLFNKLEEEGFSSGEESESEEIKEEEKKSEKNTEKKSEVTKEDNLDFAFNRFEEFEEDMEENTPFL